MTTDGFELLLPDGARPGAVRELVGDRLPVAAAGSTMSVRTFLDTFDGRLHERGLALVHADGRLALLSAASRAERAATTFTGPAERVLAAELPAGALRDALAPIVDVRALLPVVTVRARATRLNLLDDEGKTVARLTAETATVPGARTARLRPRLTVSGVRGYDGALTDARRVLEHDLGLPPAPETLYEEAAAAGGRPEGVPTKPRVELTRGEPAARAAAAVLTPLLATIEANLPGALADTDPEFLHDLRVAVRRTRSVQRQLKVAFEPRALAHARGEFRRLQQVTGPTRDLDVHLLDFDALAARLPPERAGELEPLRALLGERRRDARARMVHALRGARTRRTLTGWATLVEALPDVSGDDPPAAAHPVEELVGERIARVYRRMVRMGRAIDDDSPPEALHELRKKGKELRYLLELFGSLFPREVTKPLVRRLKALQDTLGRFQDHEVQAALLHQLREPMAGREGGPAALMAMGLLHEALDAEQATARAEFAERFAAFAAKRERRTVKETFQ